VAERLADKIATRVLGRLGSSVVPYIGWVVGVGLVVWDLVEGSQGALPQIRAALQAEEAHLAVQAEVAVAVREGLATEVDELAAALAATLLQEWRALCATLDGVCVLAINYPAFRTLLDMTELADLPRLGYQVALFQNELGAGTLTAALADGTFARLLAAPEEVYAILQWSQSPQVALAWVTVAGDLLPAVVEVGIYREIDPDTLTPLALAALAAIGDNTLTHKLLTVPAADLEVLLRLPTPDLQAIAAGATPEDLAWLAAQMAGRPPEVAAQLGRDLAQGEQSIAALRQPPATAAPPPELAAMVEPPPAAASEPRPLSGVVVASGLVLVLLVGLGVFLAILIDQDGTA
jgi:hypothetical protein